MTDDVFAQWETQFDGVEVVDVEDFSQLSAFQLVERIAVIDDQLRARGELLYPTTDTGRGLHSRRGALTVNYHNKIRG